MAMKLNESKEKGLRKGGETTCMTAGLPHKEIN
jgi:hypothetical protein